MVLLVALVAVDFVLLITRLLVSERARDDDGVGALFSFASVMLMSTEVADAIGNSRVDSL